MYWQTLFYSILLSGLLSTFALVRIPLILRENSKKLFVNFGTEPWPQIESKNKESKDLAQIIFQSPFNIILDGVVLCETQDFISAVHVTLATYYVFNLNYPKALDAFYTFLQKKILCIHGTRPPPSKVLTFMKKLKI